MKTIKKTGFALYSAGLIITLVWTVALWTLNWFHLTDALVEHIAQALDRIETFNQRGHSGKDPSNK